MIVCALLLPALTADGMLVEKETGSADEDKTMIKLPEPARDGDVSIEEALSKRRSVRSYAEGPLTLGEVSQLLWSAQGITSQRGLRAAPSAGALYPLELYIVVGDVSDLPAGIYRYEPRGHGLVKVAEGDVRADLSAASLRQESVANSAVSFVFGAVFQRTAAKYGDRAERYVHIEIGHAAENLHLQAVSLDLGTVMVGAFQDERVKKVVQMAADENPLLIMPVGRTD